MICRDTMPTQNVKDVTARWTTPPSADLWEKLKSIAASSIDGFLSLGPVLPDGEDRRLAKLSVHQCAGDELAWSLMLFPVPSSAPPSTIKDRDKQLGGRTGLLSIITEALPPGLPAVGGFMIRFRVPEVGFACPLLPVVLGKDSGHEAAMRLGREARLEQVGYRFDGGAGGIEEISIIYRHKTHEYSVIIAASGPLKLAPGRWLPFADDISDLALGAFFTPNGVVA